MRSLFLVAAALAAGLFTPSLASAADNNPHAKAVAALALASAPSPEDSRGPAVAPAPKPKAGLCKECGLLCDCPKCDCESGVTARRKAEPGVLVTDFKLIEPKSSLPPGHSYPTIAHGGRWWEWTGAAWKDVGPAPAPTGYDCSSGVCRPVSAPASYGTPYGGLTPFGGFGSGAASGGCSGGNCSPAAGGFRRR